MAKSDSSLLGYAHSHHLHSVNMINILGISELKWTGMGEFNSVIGWWHLIPRAVVHGVTGQHALQKRVEEDSSPHLHITVFQSRRWDRWGKG